MCAHAHGHGNRTPQHKRPQRLKFLIDLAPVIFDGTLAIYVLPCEKSFQEEWWRHITLTVSHTYDPHRHMQRMAPGVCLCVLFHDESARRCSVCRVRYHYVCCAATTSRVIQEGVNNGGAVLLFLLLFRPTILLHRKKGSAARSPQH